MRKAFNGIHEKYFLEPDDLKQIGIEVDDLYRVASFSSHSLASEMYDDFEYGKEDNDREIDFDLYTYDDGTSPQYVLLEMDVMEPIDQEIWGSLFKLTKEEGEELLCLSKDFEHFVNNIHDSKWKAVEFKVMEDD